jgi:hypothetical protein
MSRLLFNANCCNHQRIGSNLALAFAVSYTRIAGGRPDTRMHNSCLQNSQHYSSPPPIYLYFDDAADNSVEYTF